MGEYMYWVWVQGFDIVTVGGNRYKLYIWVQVLQWCIRGGMGTCAGVGFGNMLCGYRPCNGYRWLKCVSLWWYFIQGVEMGKGRVYGTGRDLW